MTGKYLRYKKAPFIRIISKADWEQAGVTDQEHLEWNPANNHLVPAAAVTSEFAWPFLMADPDLELVDFGAVALVVPTTEQVAKVEQSAGKK